MLPNLEELYIPYSKDADLKTSIMYWKKEAEQLGIPVEVRDACISEAFLEMANGKTFPIGPCDCGCEFPIEWSCVALNHYVLKKMIAMKDKIDIQTTEIIKQNIHAGMLSIIKTKNDEFIAEQSEQFDLFKWIRSKVWRSTGSR